MKLITCASYYGSGSSALTDLIAEYSNVKELSNFEFRFLHQLDGIADLEYFLVSNHHRMNAGHALKRFERLMSFYEGNKCSKQYSQFFNNHDFRNLTQDYIRSLLDFAYPGWQFYDLFDKGKTLYYIYQALNHAFKKINLPFFRILKDELMYCSHPSEEKFLECTQTYTHNLFKALNDENADYLEIDQLVPNSNIERYFRYIKEDIFVFIVDRDPRDVYILEKYYWRDGMCPIDVDLFCKWFKYARESGCGIPKNTSNIIKLQFEDFVYHYEETVKQVEMITGLKSENHKYKYKKLNPKKSVHNTQLWRKHPDENIKIIEERLVEYLYSFERVCLEDVKGIDVNEIKPF